MSDETTSWSKPIAVYGYNDAVDIFGGWVFEAETNCIPEHNMGQVVSMESFVLSNNNGILEKMLSIPDHPFTHPNGITVPIHGDRLVL